MAIILPKYEEMDNIELENEKYSIVGRYEPTEFLHMLIDGKFISGRYMFLLLHWKPDRPQKAIFLDTVYDNLGHICRHAASWKKIAVYERMTPIKYPEKKCGNCKHFRKHFDYHSSDDDLGLSVCLSGSCPKPEKKRQRTRWISDQPIYEDCFEWNAECAMIVREIQKIEGVISSCEWSEI